MGYLEIMINLASKNVFKFIAVSAIAVVSLSACASDNVSGATSSQSADGMMGNESALSAADIMFLQMMIPHHEQAIEMSKLAATNTKNPDVLDLAARIEAAQQPEIDLMKKWLAAAGQSDMPGHSMGDNGMMNESDMAALASAKDSGFDRLYLVGMIAHHNGAIAMAGTVSDSLNPEVKTLVNNIISSQTAEIAEMNKIVDSLPL
ncbi:MAG: DUF305 domain-containing protein [Actinobacteria bacterium]|nr:DUF305 domain-containing protein [Actinomycetota bacterium]